MCLRVETSLLGQLLAILGQPQGKLNNSKPSPKTTEPARKKTNWYYNKLKPLGQPKPKE